MNAGDTINNIVYFFNDLIGNVLPGFLLIVGGFFINNRYGIIQLQIIPFEGNFKYFTIIALSYIAGHGVLSIYNVANNICKFHDHKAEEVKYRQDQLYLDLIKVLQSRLTKSFKNLGPKLEVYSPKQIRNIAMTISPEGQKISVRFMFISLLCIGVSTSMAILLVTFLVVRFALFSLDAISFKILIFIVIYLFGVYAFHDRGVEFGKRSFRTPFSIALAELLSIKEND